MTVQPADLNNFKSPTNGSDQSNSSSKGKLGMLFKNINSKIQNKLLKK